MNVKTVNLYENYKLIKKNLFKNLNNLFLTQKFILGNEVNILEKNLSKQLKVKYTLGVSSGSDALIVALLACGIKKYDELCKRKGFLNQLRFYWFVLCASLRDIGKKKTIKEE